MANCSYIQGVPRNQSLCLIRSSKPNSSRTHLSASTPFLCATGGQGNMLLLKQRDILNTESQSNANSLLQARRSLLHVRCTGLDIRTLSQVSRRLMDHFLGTREYKDTKQRPHMNEDKFSLSSDPLIPYHRLISLRERPSSSGVRF